MPESYLMFSKLHHYDGKRSSHKIYSWAVGLLLLFILSFGLYSTLISHASDALGGVNFGLQSTDWWPMRQHDVQHTGYSTSKAPTTNYTLWTANFKDWVQSSPVVHNNLVFIGSDENIAGGWGALRAFNATTGKSVWNFTATGSDVKSIPAVAYGRVYFGSNDKKLYCLDEATGSYQWNFTTNGQILSSPCVTDNKVVFGSDDNKLYCLDATIGTMIWSYSTGNKIQSSPAVSDGKVFFGSHDMKAYALNLTNGALIWSYNTGGIVRGSPSVVNGKVYVPSSSKIFCLNAANGGFVWSYTTGGSIYSSPAVAYDNVYIGSDDYKLYCLNAVNGAFKWSYITGREIYSSPAVAAQKVFFGSFDNVIYSLNATTGTLIWSYRTAGSNCRIYSSPAIADRVAYVAYSYGTFFAELIAFETPNQPPIAANLALTPPFPFTTNDVTGSYDYSDPDGDPESGTEIRWYKNAILQPVYNDLLIVPHTATSKGELWRFTVKPKDGEDFGELQISPTATIHNSPPIIDGVTITPDPAYTNTDLTATPYGWFDDDGDAEACIYQWQKWDGIVWQNITGATSNTLESSHFAKEDQIKIISTPYDGTDHGAPRENTITIQNTPPTIVLHYPTTDPTIDELDSQEFNVTYSDQDGDLITVQWYLNGTPSVTTDYYIFSEGSPGSYNVTVAVSDGDLFDNYTWMLTVIPVGGHDVAVINVTTSKTGCLPLETVGQGYNVTIITTVENQGDFIENFDTTVFADFNIIGIHNTTLSPGENTTLIFTWTTSGFLYGNYTISVVAETLPGEIDTADNILNYGEILVTIPGDINGDTFVNAKDAVQLGVAFGSTSGDLTWNANADINGDGFINAKDAVILGYNFDEQWE